jgi:mannose-6-phosphate isomerase-like protein (cupin superfamily)
MKYLAFLTLGLTAIALAAEPPPTEAIQFDRALVGNAFANGLPIHVNTRYKIQAGRRVMPGVVEIHEQDTDIFYVTEGTATFVTGGTPVDPQPSATGEIRAKEMTGGTVHHLTKGDVIVIPNGVPHQFTEVSGTFLYFVVKVTK